MVIGFALLCYTPDINDLHGMRAMAIDYIIEYDCIPKQQFSAAGILERIKEKERAQEVIQWFRAAGDTRPPAQMGFEFSRSTPDEKGEKQVIVVQDLLDHAAQLDEWEYHCSGCPANGRDHPFGCMGFIRYPISARAETWLLERLPVPDEPLLWLLLKQGIRKFGYDGSSVKLLRDRDDTREEGGRTYFELPAAPQRRLGELRVSGDQTLEMIFGVGERIMPNHAGILLLFFDAIDRSLEAAEIHDISSFDEATRGKFAFRMAAEPDDEKVYEFLAFFHALYLAWKLKAALFVDA